MDRRERDHVVLVVAGTIAAGMQPLPGMSDVMLKAIATTAVRLARFVVEAHENDS